MTTTYTHTSNYHAPYTKTSVTGYSYIISRVTALKARVVKVKKTAIKDNKWSDLHLAVGAQDIELVKVLCTNKTINEQDAKYRTPLELAIVGGNLDIIEFLVQNDGQVAPNNIYGWSAIHLAIKIGNLDIVKYLYENTKFCQYDKFGLTLQDWAATLGHKHLVQFFLNKHKTPLELAVASQDILSVKALINEGAEFEIKSELGQQIFNLVIDDKDIELSEYLANKFLGNQLNNNHTLLEKIVQIHDKKINIAKLAKALIEKSGCNKIDNILGQKLLGKALQANDLDLVQTLHSKGVKLDYKDMLGRTSLHFAIKAEAGEEIMQFLIDNVTDIHARDKSGSTYLHWAANSHNVMTTKLLLAKGAHISSTDCLNQTPLNLAKHYGDEEMVELLTLGDHSIYAL